MDGKGYKNCINQFMVKYLSVIYVILINYFVDIFKLLDMVKQKNL